MRTHSERGPRPLPTLVLGGACRGVGLAAGAQGALSALAGGAGARGRAARSERRCRGRGPRRIWAWRAAVRRAGRGGGGGRAASERAGGRGGGGGGGGRSWAPLPALRSSMALPRPPEQPRGAPRKAPSLLEMGALCLDSEIILGFTNHLLRRRAKVSEGGGTAGGRGAVPRLCGAAPAAEGAARGRRHRS